MASTERSLGWATGVALTDGSSAYDTTRMTAMEKNTLGNGILLTGSYLQMTNTTTVLTIADGAAVINGYFYESNGAVTISSTALGAATYSILIIANTSGASLAITANGAGTLTILAATTRAALVTAAQLATITAAVGSSNFITLGTVVVAAGLFTTLTPYNQFVNSRQQSTQQFCTGSGGTVSLGTSAFTSLTNYTSNVNSTDGSITFTLVNGQISIFQSGVYQFYFNITFDSNTTGNRMGSILNLGSTPVISASLFATNANYSATVTANITVTPGTPQTYFLQGWSSVASRSVTDSLIICTRL